MQRWQEDETENLISVYGEGINILVEIEEVSDGANERVVKLNISKSHIANCSMNKWANLSACNNVNNNKCYQINDSVNPSIEIYCYDLVNSTIVGSLNPDTNSQIKFFWSFNEQPINPKYLGNYIYTYVFSQIGRYTVKLNIAYKP